MTADGLALDFNPLHTLGFLLTDWIEQHCRVPGGVYEGEPLTFDGWQLFCTANHYRVLPDAVADPRRLIAPFMYRRSVIVGPQKCGKSPWGAGMLLGEGVGPTLFDGWARGGEKYRCEAHGCGCGWESQTNNVYEPLQSMIRSGPLADFVHVREGFIRLPNYGKIIPLSAAAKSKLGQPLTGGLGDESGLYTARNKVLDTWQTMRRGIAAMQGRTIELTNPWDPMENSAAQQAFNSRQKDIFRYYRKPPADLSYKNKRERHKIHVYVYADSPWVDPESVDAEAAELVETDPTQAERFFGNRLVQGLGSYMLEKLWDGSKAEGPSADLRIAVGFDGSRSGDWTAIRCETADGYRFTPTYGPDRRPAFWNPEEWEGRIPREEVKAAMAEVFASFKVARVYADPRHWETQIDEWALEHGEDVVVQWPTNQIGRMFDALVRFLEDTAEGMTTHDGDATAKLHALAARKIAKPGDKYILGKPSESQKFDILMADVLAHEAAADMRAQGWTKEVNRTVVVSRRR